MPEETSNAPAVDDQVAKKRKVEISDLVNSSDHETTKHSSASAAPEAPAPTSSDASAVEVSNLQQELDRTDESLRALQSKREGLAKRLKALGQQVIVKPWTTEHLETHMNAVLGDLRETVGDTEDLRNDMDEETVRQAIEVLKMITAIKGKFQTDGEGYIDANGDYIAFEATEDEVGEFQWVDAEVLW